MLVEELPFVPDQEDYDSKDDEGDQDEDADFYIPRCHDSDGDFDRATEEELTSYSRDVPERPVKTRCLRRNCPLRYPLLHQGEGLPSSGNGMWRKVALHEGDVSRSGDDSV